MDSLLDLVATDPLPRAHTSSHWEQFGRDTVVRRRGDDIVLEARGFEPIVRRGVAGRVVNLLERLSYRRVTSSLHSYPSVWKTATHLARDLSGSPTFNVFKSAVAFALLVDHWTRYRLSPKTFAVIGDGYGFLGALIRRCLPDTRVYCVDLPKPLVFQARTHRSADPEVRMSVVLTTGPYDSADVMFVMPQAIERISDTLDCAINIASMQEMNTFSIRAYFKFLRERSAPQSRFYCVNRRHKVLPGGEVAAFADYPWQGDDEIFADGPCPYYTHFFGWPTLPDGPRLWGRRVPLVNHFEGVHMHRLVRLTPTR